MGCVSWVVMHSLGQLIDSLPCSFGFFVWRASCTHTHEAHASHRQAVLHSHSGNLVGYEPLKWLGADGDDNLHVYRLWTGIGAAPDVDLLHLYLVLCGRYVS